MSMRARKYTCKVLDTDRPTQDVIRVRFQPNKKLIYEAGQFLSVAFDHPNGEKKPVRRAYSFTSPYELAIEEGYEICVKLEPHGLGAAFLKNLKPGDEFQCTAPYGDFVYQRPKSSRGVCFIATGTGIAPLRAMALSKEFQNHPPMHASCLFGVRTEQDILYPGSFEAAGIEMVYALSQSQAKSNCFPGRVTEYLKELPIDWAWHTTDFYICGNGNMVGEVKRILMGGHGVSEKSIFQEVFFAGRREEAPPPSAPSRAGKDAA